MSNKLKDVDNHWLEKLPISKELRDEMIKETATRILRKIAAVKEFLMVDGYEDICGGLYTFALEEYGKILLLQNYPTTDIIEIKYKDGFRSHRTKFNLAEHKLPSECLRLNAGEFNKEEFNPEEFNTDVAADLEARLGVFFTDFTDSADRTRRIPTVRKVDLEKAIKAFESFLGKQKLQ